MFRCLQLHFIIGSAFDVHCFLTKEAKAQKKQKKKKMFLSFSKEFARTSSHMALKLRSDTGTFHLERPYSVSSYSTLINSAFNNVCRNLCFVLFTAQMLGLETIT